MTRQEYAERIQAIAQLGSIEEARVELVNLQRELEADFDIYEGVVNERDRLQNRVRDLEASNMDLYLQIPKSNDKKKTDKPNDYEPENQDLKYEDLFDDKGGLK